MRWQRKKPLWPYVACLAVLFALALDAPRNWQSSPQVADLNAPTPLVGSQPWYDILYPPAERTLDPISSPVIEPELPAVEEPLEQEFLNRHHLAAADPEPLPHRAEFNFDTLMEIRDSLKSLVDKLPELPQADSPVQPTISARSNQVLVTSPADRLAMRSDLDRPVQVPQRVPYTQQQRLERFADMLIDAASQRARVQAEPIRVATRPPIAEIPAKQEPTEGPAGILPPAELEPTAPVEQPVATLTLSPAEEISEQQPAANQRSQEELSFIEPINPLFTVDAVQLPVAVSPESTSLEFVFPGRKREESDYSVALADPVIVSDEPQLAAELAEPTMEAVIVESEPQQEATPPALPLLRTYPRALVNRLEAVSSKSPAHAWAQETLQLVEQLATGTDLNSEDATALLQRLREHAASGRQNAETVADHALRQHWLRLIHSLGCRTEVWAGLFDPTMKSIPATLQVPTPRDSEVIAVLNDIVVLLEGEENGEAWRDYLLLDQVATASSPGAGIDPRGRRKLAQEVLSRLTDPRLTSAQQEFVATAPVAALQRTVLPWAVGPINIETLAALVERYDATGDSRYGAALAQLSQRLQWSPVPEYQQLAAHLNEYYRGANMRVAISDDLLQRMLPQPKASVSPVNDHIAGAKVKGRSRTTVKLETRMIPNDEAWQIALVAKGAVYSKTKSDTWPASVNNSARMFYEAQKTIKIDSQGLRVSRTKASARGRNELVGIDSDFDPIPILSHLVKDVARRKHHHSRGIANRQVKAKVVRQAKTRMDRDADPRLRRLEEAFAEKVLTGLEKLALLAEPTEMYTTEDRAVMQLRLANSFQLAANSLRPLAPSDSLASLQLHESVLNNAIAGLGLEGRRMTAHELHDFIASRLGRTDAEPPADLPERARIEFAPYNAVRVNCHGDRIELVLKIKEVAHGRDKIRDFTVHAYFRPTLDGLDVRLVREGILQFEGKHLRTGPRVVLHSVFGKLLRKDQEVQVLKDALVSDPRLNGIMVTQLVIDDGWIGLALGPKFEGRTAWRTLPHVVR